VLPRAPGAADDVLGALLDTRDPGEKVLVAGVVVGDQVPGERGGDAAADAAKVRLRGYAGRVEASTTRC
jgi:hypothetical protein